MFMKAYLPRMWWPQDRIAEGGTIIHVPVSLELSYQEVYGDTSKVQVFEEIMDLPHSARAGMWVEGYWVNGAMEASGEIRMHEVYLEDLLDLNTESDFDHFEHVRALYQRNVLATVDKYI